jgi:hypothetical protein
MTNKRRLFSSACVLAFLSGLLMLVSAAHAASQPATFTTQNYPLLGNNHIAADFNGDGKLDVAGTGANSAAVMLNNGNGTFQPKIDYSVGGQAQDLAAGDFNGDGKTDAVVTINTPQISLSLLIGNGNGTFNAPVHFSNTSGFDSPAIIATDLNNDGKLDVVIAHQIACFTAPCTVARTISVMLGNGDGTFQPTREIDVGTGMSRIAVGDFNRDGVKDLGIAGDSAHVYVLIGVGNGTFVQQPTITLVAGNTIGVDATDIDVGDFNHDAVEDLVVAIGLNGSRTAILMGNGDGTFRQPSIITDTTLSVPHYQAVADYNGDGFQDLGIALGDGTRGLMEILNGNGDGTFQAPIYYLIPPPLSSIGGGTLVTGDFNSDGKPDIALQVRGASPALDVLTNSTGTPPPVTVSALTFNPTTVTGGNAVAGTLTLSARIQTATVVQLASNSAAATVPASVTVVAGASSASFTVNTTQVSVATSATITASLNGAARSATITINPVTSSVDTVSIKRAEYDASKRALRVEATSSRSNVTLQVFVTSSGQLIGTLANNGGGRYGGQFNVSTNPQRITVRSSLGGQATRSVTLK